MSKVIVMSVGFMLAAGSLRAEAEKYWSDTPVTCHWIGKVIRSYTTQSDYDEGRIPMPRIPYAQWTNHNNWAEGIVPGRIEVVQEDGSVVTNGSLGCTAVFDGNSDIRCVEVYGLVSVSNIVVTGASTPQIILGHWRWDNPYLGVEAGGGIFVDGDVPVAPYVIPQIIPHNATPGCDLITFENNSPQPLNIGYIGKIFPPASSWYGTLKIIYKGTGHIIKRNRNYNEGWAAQMMLDMDGGELVSHSVTNQTHGFATADNYYYIRDGERGHKQKIRIPEGKFLAVVESAAIITCSGMDIAGDGFLYLQKNGALPYVCAAAGKELDISVNILREKTVTAGYKGLQIGYGDYPGKVKLSGKNAFEEKVVVTSAATLEVPSFGYGAVDGPVGREGVMLQGLSFLRYVGNGETTDRVLSGTGLGTVILAGSGDLVWKGEVSGGTTYSYSISNETASARFVYANKSLSKSITLLRGSRFAFAKPDDSDSVSAAKITLAGDACIDLVDGVAVVVDEFARTTGRLAVNSTNGGVLKISGMPEGYADWVTLNGKTAYFLEDGTLFAPEEKANDIEISSNGSAVPDAPGKVVGITSAGDGAAGNNSLEKDDTTILALNQETAQDAVVGLSEGQTLNVNLIQLKSGAGDLAVGNVQGEGSVSVKAGAFETRVADADSTLVVNAAFDVPATCPVKATGPGTTVFSAFNGYEGLLTLAGANVVLTNSSNVKSARLSGSGVFDFAGGVMRLASSDENGIDATYESDEPVSIAVTGGVLRLTGANPLPVDEIRVPHGELVLDGVNLYSPGFSMDMTDDPRKTLIVGSNGTAVVRFEGGTITGSLELASWVSAVARGAMYQNGGEFVNLTPYKECYTMGFKGYAYYALSGGRYVAAGDWYLGAYGEGVLDIAGGELYHTPASVRKSRCRIGGWTGYAAVRVADGGVFNATNASESVVMPGYDRSETMTEFTIEDGGSALLNDKGMTIAMGKSETYSHAIVNLNGGIISSYSIARNISRVCPSEEWPEGTCKDQGFANTYAFINCNGGTFRNLGWGAIFGMRSSTQYPPNRVTLYEHGLTVDTDGKDCRIDAGGGLKAPSGKGVIAVPWDAEKDGKGYVGSPFIRIVGDGLGATAWADFDTQTRTVTGIHVTSPGNDYTYATAELVMNNKVVKSVPCTVGATVSGGLTKIGRGILKICETNTYAGATVVKKGTIMLVADDVINSSSKLVLDGGVLDMNGRSQTFSGVDVTENGGSVVNGTLSLSGLSVDFDDVLAGRPLVYDGSVDFAPGAKFELLDAAKVPAPSPFGYRLAEIKGGFDWSDFSVSEETLEALPGRWRILRTGNRFVLRYQVGTVVTFR